MEPSFVCIEVATVRVQASEVLPSNHSTAVKGEHRMSTEENRAIVRQYLEEAWIKGNVGIIDELMAVNYARHMAGFAPPLNREGQKQRITAFRRAFPDLRLTIDDLIAEGDQVVFRITLRGTHQGAFMGISPTGKPVTVTAIDIARFVNGKIVDHWGQMDALGLMQQLGVAPTPGQSS
jgi:predicted ester cyclase